MNVWSLSLSTARLLWVGDRGQLQSAGEAEPGKGSAEQEHCLAELSGAGSRFPSLEKAHLSLIGSNFESHVSLSFVAHPMICD